MTTLAYQAERTIAAVFKEERQLDEAVRRLLERQVPKEYISVLGRNFQSQTRIAGFITKKDVILGGLRSGAIYGSLFGSLFSLLTGVGVLFVPFVGPVVAAGPIGAALLGAASGAAIGTTGVGLASALATLGMPQEKAAVFQTRLEAGEFLLMLEAPADKSGEFQLLLESAGAEDVELGDRPLPRACEGPCQGPDDLSPEVRSHLSAEAQTAFIERYNAALGETQDATEAEHLAWAAVREGFVEDDRGVWSPPSS